MVIIIGKMDPKVYWVGFNFVKGIGAVRTRAILDQFHDLETAWHAPIDEFEKIGFSRKILENIQLARNQMDLDKIWTNLLKKEIQVITWGDEIYPRRLREVDQPPPVLYIRGELKPEDEWAVAVVGTRRMTVYGRQVTEDLAGFLAANGITVISGLARGIDSTAHSSVLKNGGRTLAVLGCGVDQIYPPENRKLIEEIIHHGAIVSEYPPGTPPDANNFPQRNRIISGLSQATVIVEAGETSGALITATFAAEQGREVFAVPGNILAPQSKGCNRLIREGAHPYLQPQDVLELLNLEQVQEYKQARLMMPGDEIESKLIDVLENDILPIDEITSRAGLTADKVSAALTIMELKGLVRQVEGTSYMVIREVNEKYDPR
jgi:DNA processing protein